MNEQIQKLLNVCGMPNEDLMDIYSDTNKSFYMQKFAELIVQECAKAADEGLAQVTMKVEWPSYNIKKHFGVEE